VSFIYLNKSTPRGLWYYLVIYLTPCVPLSFKGEGEGLTRGAKPLLIKTPLPLDKGRGIKGEGLVDSDKGKEED